MPVAADFVVAVDVEIVAVALADVGLAGAGLADVGLADVELVDAGTADAETADAGTAGVGAGLVDVGLAGVGLSVGAGAFVAVVKDVDAAVDIVALGEPVASVQWIDIRHNYMLRIKVIIFSYLHYDMISKLFNINKA